MAHKDQDNACARAEDLVAYLYRETSEIEAKSFERHLAECAACRQELGDFGHTRTMLDASRAEAARTFAPLAIDFPTPSFAAATNDGPFVRERERSAWAALNEFFRLAPLWMRTGVAAAGLIFCALISLALLNSELRVGETRIALRRPAPVHVVEKAASVEGNARAEDKYTQAQVDELIAARVTQALADFRAANPNASATSVPIDYRVKNNRGVSRKRSPAVIADRNAGTAGGERRAPSQFDSEEEGLQLADLLSQVK
ncbi:MAG TPA: zf-HC2 domain-containing protein [Pyrinomonadaceae bacterium]|nr:zf-HC2 domain-containing protein [Pyrinomonadaceae bacterium]